MTNLKLSQISQSKVFRTLGPALAGFIGYGAWGFFCNYAHEMAMGLKAGLIQGSLSFAITLIINSVMETLFGLTKQKWMTVICCSALVVLASYSAQKWAGTPEIFWTIAPGAILSAIYIYSYVTALRKMISA